MYGAFTFNLTSMNIGVLLNMTLCNRHNYSTRRLFLLKRRHMSTSLYGGKSQEKNIIFSHRRQDFVLRRIFGPRRDEVTGEWRRLHNEEINDLYSSPNIVRVIKSRRIRWAGHVARMGDERGVCRVLVGKLEGKRPLGRPRRRWVDNIRMDLQEVGCGHMDWIGLAQDRDRWRTLVSAVMNLGVP